LFNSHLKNRLSALPATATPDEVEAVKSDFYRDWVNANESRMDDWVRGWWSDLRRDIWDGARKMLARH
jgi:hypothetical protein